MSIGVLTIGGHDAGRGLPVLHAERTFFGVYRVTQDRQGRIPRARARNDAARHAGAARPRTGRAAHVFSSRGPIRTGVRGTFERAAAERRGGDWPRHRHAGRLCAAGTTLDVLRDRRGRGAHRPRSEILQLPASTAASSAASSSATRGFHWHARPALSTTSWCSMRSARTRFRCTCSRAKRWPFT